MNASIKAQLNRLRPLLKTNASKQRMMSVLSGSSGAGKSMLSRLSEIELAEWWKWAKARPDGNGMDWPGWAAVRARKAAAMPGDSSQSIAGLVYNDAFRRF